MKDQAARVERFRELYDVAYPRIVAYALRRARTREDAFDVVSETFLVVWRLVDDIPGDERLALPWVFGVARRTLANQYRSLDRRGKLERKLSLEQGRDEDQGSAAVVHQALARLRPQDQEILTLAAWDDLDNVEISEMLGVSERRVAVRLHRARKRLVVELSMLGLQNTGTASGSVRSEAPNRTLDLENGTALGSEGEETS